MTECAVLQRSTEAEDEPLRKAFQRAVRSVPASGETWARYMRFVEREGDGDDDEAELIQGKLLVLIHHLR